MGDDPSPEFLIGLETILSTRILKMKRELEGIVINFAKAAHKRLPKSTSAIQQIDSKKALHDSKKAHTVLEREHAACLQRYILEMEKKEAESKAAKQHLAELIETVSFKCDCGIRTAPY